MITWNLKNLKSIMVHVAYGVFYCKRIYYVGEDQLNKYYHWYKTKLDKEIKLCHGGGTHMTCLTIRNGFLESVVFDSQVKLEKNIKPRAYQITYAYRGHQLVLFKKEIKKQFLWFI